jgi:hypothetical protein
VESRLKERVTAVACFGAFVRRALPAALIDAAMIAALKKQIHSTANGRE